jgi:hypothetical protein
LSNSASVNGIAFEDAVALPAVFALAPAAAFGLFELGVFTVMSFFPWIWSTIAPFCQSFAATRCCFTANLLHQAQYSPWRRIVLR